MKRIASHSVLIACLTLLGLILWTCCGSKPTEEQRAKRKAFEEKLAKLEKEHAERLRAQKAAAKAGAKQDNAGSTTTADEKKDEGVDKDDVSVTEEDENQTPKTAADKKDD